MTQNLNQTSPEKLDLFKVTLPWNQNNLDEGSFCEDVWATDSADAIREIAILMAEMSDTHRDDMEDGEFEQLVEDYISGANSISTQRVSLQVMADLGVLISGPLDAASEESLQQLQVMREALLKCGFQVQIADAEEELDLDDVAEWVGLHYARVYSCASKADQKDWQERYIESHSDCVAFKATPVEVASVDKTQSKDVSVGVYNVKLRVDSDGHLTLSVESTDDSAVIDICEDVSRLDSEFAVRLSTAAIEQSYFHESDEVNASPLALNSGGDVGLSMTAYDVMVACGDSFWGSCAQFPKLDWLTQVSEDQTIRGYWDWVVSEAEVHGVDLATLSAEQKPMEADRS